MSKPTKIEPERTDRSEKSEHKSSEESITNNDADMNVPSEIKEPNLPAFKPMLDDVSKMLFGNSIIDYRAQCSASGPVKGFPGPIGLGQLSSSAALLLFSNGLGHSNGLITNMSVAPSSSFYFSLSPFESILLGLIVLKLMLLRYLNILPLDLNKLVTGDVDFSNTIGRKKRSISSDPKVIKEKERLAETMFTVLRRLDMQDCLLRTLCELQIHSLHGYKLPSETKLTLSALSKSGWNRAQNHTSSSNPDFLEDRPVLSVFEEAVRVGWESRSPNGTECQERYFICPLNKKDILGHFETVKVINVL